MDLRLLDGNAGARFHVGPGAALRVLLQYTWVGVASIVQTILALWALCLDFPRESHIN